MSFLQLQDKTFLITGVANKKSVAYFVAKTLEGEGAKIVLTVQSAEHFEKVQRLFPNSLIEILDVEKEADFLKLNKVFSEKEIVLNGLLHSMAFANYSEGIKPFHETPWSDYAQAARISCFSLSELANALKDHFDPNASVVTISISNTKATSYGYMGPIKAMLDSTVGYLAKSFSAFSRVRFNAVCAGPLKTSASAGIPGYVNNYLFAEKMILRKESLQTQEVADTAVFLLSSRSSGINGTGVLVDAGMILNTFDEEVVDLVSR